VLSLQTHGWKDGCGSISRRGSVSGAASREHLGEPEKRLEDETDNVVDSRPSQSSERTTRYLWVPDLSQQLNASSQVRDSKFIDPAGSFRCRSRGKPVASTRGREETRGWDGASHFIKSWTT